MHKNMMPLIEKAKKDEEVVALAIFGSFARKEKYKDIDVCIFLKEKKSNLDMSKKKLSYLKGAKSIFDIKIFQQLPIHIRHKVLKEGKIILCKDENKLYDIAASFIKEYEDFKPIYESYLEAVKYG
ncbi:MAG: nucleotidyltransferase domain-containing protein [Candidatus Aenigmarchaeota archaeon]|nr:nucleotidyltransferase domain-containing protein [Candidatus Aenigmarchaeota archaeon]